MEKSYSNYEPIKMFVTLHYLALIEGQQPMKWGVLSSTLAQKARRQFVFTDSSSIHSFFNHNINTHTVLVDAEMKLWTLFSRKIPVENR